jgi:hypothetical protein
MSVEKLSDDFLTTMGTKYNSGFFGASFVEAPMIFKRYGIYYAVFGSCCCYCRSGSPVTVHTALHPLGPWTVRNNIGVQAPSGGASIFLNSWNLRHSQQGSSISSSGQSTDIFSYTDKAGSQQFMFIGDRWQSAPDGIKGHDFTYFFPLSFTADGNVTAMQLVDSFEVDL